MDSDTKGKVKSGMKWSGLNTLATQVIQFIVSLVIARRLIPEDYGLIGMLGIFMAISTTFIDSGFGSALIQKKDATDKDFSTAFYFNIVVAIFFYLMIYLCAPLIADFYGQTILVPITRIYCLSIPIGALCQAHGARLSKYLNFKAKMIMSTICALVYGVTGIVLAYCDFGVWALVWAGLASGLANAIMAWLFTRWTPSLIFSIASFKALVRYGGNILGSGLINTIYNNLSPVIIGKVYKASDLGLFSRAKGFATLPGSIITSTVVGINFPILSQLQDDDARLLEAYRVMLRMPLFLLYPALFGMSAIAYPLIDVLLGEKWIATASMIPIICFGCLWEPLTHINLNLLYVKGRTDLVLRLELMKKPIGFTMLIGAIPFGIYGMCWSISLYSFVAFCFNCYYTKKILNYGFGAQVFDFLPILGYSVLMAITVIIVTLMLPTSMMKLVMGIVIGLIAYYLLVRIFNDPSYISLRSILNSKLPVPLRGLV